MKPAYTWGQYEKDEQARLASLEATPQAGTLGGGYQGKYAEKSSTKKEEIMFSAILKDSAGAKKAWVVRGLSSHVAPAGQAPGGVMVLAPIPPKESDGSTSTPPPETPVKEEPKAKGKRKAKRKAKKGDDGVEDDTPDDAASPTESPVSSSLSRILKTSAGALKAWKTRQRNAAAKKPAPAPAAKPAKASKPAASVVAKPAKVTKPVEAPAAPVAKKWPDPVPSPKNRLSPEAPPEHKAKMVEYMAGYSSKLKNPKEKAYVEARVAQMIAGTPRPSGMSAKYGLTKQRAVQYEILNEKIFNSGRLKHNI